MTETTSELMTLDDAAALLEVSKATMYRLLTRGTLRGAKVGRQWRFARTELQAYLQRGPAAMALSTLPLATLEEEIAFIARELGKRGAALPVIPEGADDWDNAVTLLLTAVVTLATVMQASDLHLETLPDGAETAGLLRFRIDGIVTEIRRLPARVLEALILRCRQPIDQAAAGQERTPWCDGLLELTDGGQSLRLRVNVLPGTLGETLCAHLLGEPPALRLPMEQIGVEAADVARLRRWLSHASGLVLVSGPTGSGKTTLLHKLVQEVSGPERVTVAVEDPVEYQLPWVSHIHVNKRGIAFASVLRGLMRHDVDTIMIGELRDLESIEIGVYGATTGKRILSQLHAQEPARVFARIVEVFPEVQQESIATMLANALVGVIGMRLARVLCPHCKQPVTPPRATLAQVYDAAAAGGCPLADDAVFYGPVGCEACHGTGYRGRIGLYELLETTPELRAAYQAKAPLDELRAVAYRTGAVSLQADGLRKAAAGITAIEEVLRVV